MHLLAAHQSLSYFFFRFSMLPAHELVALPLSCSGAYTARPVSAQRPARSPAPQAPHHQEDTACAPISPAPPTIATTDAPSIPVQASVSAAPLPAPAEAPWSAPAHIVPAAGSVPHRAGSAVRERSGRSPVMFGKSWGTYDPITCVWKVPPGDSKFSDPDALVDKQAGVSGQSMGRSPQQHGECLAFLASPICRYLCKTEYTYLLRVLVFVTVRIVQYECNCHLCKHSCIILFNCGSKLAPGSVVA